MSGPVGNANSAISLAIRRLVSAYLDTQGFETTAKPHYQRISDSLDAALAPDVAGLPLAHLHVSSRLQHRLSDDLDSARGGGAVNGAEIAAFVQYRPEREISESYVVLGLDHFAKLVHLAERPT